MSRHSLHWSRPLLATLSLLGLAGCQLSHHPAEEAKLGVARPASELLRVIERPGPAAVETVVGADWQVDRSGLLNLDHARARAAGIEDAREPIHVYFHAIRHPEHGLFLVDTGVERALVADPEQAAIQGIVASVMKVDEMTIRNDTASWIARQPAPPAGVFMTHLHLDHVSGMRDVPDATPIYAGPGETADRSFQNLAVAPNVDRALAGKGPIQEWRFEPEPEAAFEAVLDVFGDGSVWAIHVPGHTPGSTAYLVRTPTGPVLLVGDASHTDWGWQHGVEPGSFSSDGPRSAGSLARLRAFAQAHPAVEVRLGHQPLGASALAAAPAH